MFFINDFVLSKFNYETSIRAFVANLNYPCQSTFAAICQSVMRGDSTERQKEIFNALAVDNQQLIIENLNDESEKLAESPDFGIAVQEAVRAKLLSLSPEKQAQVYESLTQVAGMDWCDNEYDALERLPQLADVLVSLESSDNVT